MHHGKPPFNDARVRKAVALATDREKMIEIAAEGWGVLGGYIGPHTPFGCHWKSCRSIRSSEKI